MSSVYRPICMSHSPAIPLWDVEWQSGDNGCEKLEAVLADPRRYAHELEGHANCELLGGRFSYALVEVYCPPVKDTAKHPTGCYHPHSGEWIDFAWLRLLVEVDGLHDPDAALTEARRSVRACWSAERVKKLEAL